MYGHCLSKDNSKGETTVFRLKCQDATMWQIRLQDERLNWYTRIQLHAHLLLCDSCREFKQQMQTLEQGVQKWKEHSD